jgi:hypothetical protein
MAYNGMPSSASGFAALNNAADIYTSHDITNGVGGVCCHAFNMTCGC